MPEPVVLAFSASVKTAAYVIRRSHRKHGDKGIETARNHERAVEHERGRPSDQYAIIHCFHPQHTLVLEIGGNYTCDACLKTSKSDWYCCDAEQCNFKMHKACAFSGNTLSTMVETKHNLETTCHEKHPLNIIQGTSKFTCKHCYETCYKKSRYHCNSCNKSFHLICATHPTRLTSFLHPEHELELFVRPHFKICAVCHHRGESSTRVYGCKACEFYVHPSCAERAQYRDLPSPDGGSRTHLLVYREVPGYEVVMCVSCGKACKHWRYTSPIDSKVNFHDNCLSKHTSSIRSTVEEVAEELIDGIVEELAGHIFIALQHLFT